MSVSGGGVRRGRTAPRGEDQRGSLEANAARTPLTGSGVSRTGKDESEGKGLCGTPYLLRVSPNRSTMRSIVGDKDIVENIFTFCSSDPLL